MFGWWLASKLAQAYRPPVDEEPEEERPGGHVNLAGGLFGLALFILMLFVVAVALTVWALVEVVRWTFRRRTSW